MGRSAPLILNLTRAVPNGVPVRLVQEDSIASRVLRSMDSVASYLGEGAYGLLGYVCNKGCVTAMELTDYLQRRMKVSRDLKPLAEKGILDWHGSSTHNPSHCYDPHGFKWVRVAIAYVDIAGDYTSANWRWASCVIQHPPRANERGK